MLRCVVQRFQTTLVWSTYVPRKLVVLGLENSRGVSQGDPDNIEKTYYTWGMQLDTVEWEDEEGVCQFAFPRPVHIARFASQCAKKRAAWQWGFLFMVPALPSVGRRNS
eukprot:COSAG02_NODE_392_length_23227_cov_30.763620_14_plen_109_part_00